MTRYNQKLEEISKARNSSNTAAKVRGIKWTSGQINKMRKMAALETSPNIDTIKCIYPNLGEYKALVMLEKVKKFRKEMAEITGYAELIHGVQDSAGNGAIYLVENSLYEGWIKCGMTTNMKSRLISYNCYDPLKRFNLIIEKNVVNRRKSESVLIHNLKMVATLNNGEWFRIDKNIALDIFNNIK